MKRSFNMSVSGLIVAFALAIQGGCAGNAKVTQPAAQAEPEQKDAATQSVKEGPILAGKVVETMNAGEYTYICLEKDGKKGWSAVPAMEVKVGDELDLVPGAEMGPFTSKSLNRTFDKIVFSGGPRTKTAEKQAALPSGHPTIPAMPPMKETAKPSPENTPPVDNSKMADKPFYSGKVVETMDSGGYTYVCLEKDGMRSWAAVPHTKIKVGEDIELLPGTEMGAFRSKTLNRTFNNIIFSAGVAPKK